MATSGSVDFGVTFTANQIIQSSLEDLGVMQAGDTTSSTSFTDHSAGALVKLNALVKQFGYPIDGSTGMQAWAIKRGYLFLQTGQSVYTLGPTTTATGATNKWANAYVSSTLAVAGVPTDTTVTLAAAASTVGIADTYRIAVELDSGALQWTTVNGTPSGAVVTLAVAGGLTGAAAIGNRVFSYDDTATVQGRRPLEIISAVLRDVNGKDTPLDRIRTVEEYESLPDKGADGTPSAYYYERTLKDGTLYLDCEPTDVTQVLRITYRSPFEDFDTAASDDADFDPVWARALIHSLSYELCPRFGLDGRMPAIKALRDEALAIARNTTPEVSDAYFQPGEPDY